MGLRNPREHQHANNTLKKKTNFWAAAVNSFPQP